MQLCKKCQAKLETVSRNSKFNATVAALVIQYLRQGSTLKSAAERARVTRQTIWNWRQAGRRLGTGPLFEFDLEVTKLNAEQIAHAENRLQQHIADKKNPMVSLNATKFFLEKRAAEEYGDKEVLAIQLRQEMALELVDHLQEVLDVTTFERVLAALDSSSGDYTETPKALTG